MPVITEATLNELHGELAEKLKAAHGKPLMIAVAYIDETKDDRFQYWMCCNNNFAHDDIYKTLCHLAKQAIDNSEPINDLKVVEKIKPQLQVRKQANLQG